MSVEADPLQLSMIGINHAYRLSLAEPIRFLTPNDWFGQTAANFAASTVCRNCALMASGRKPGILVALDFEFVEVEAGKAVFAGRPGEHAYNPIGTVHGGYAATLLDSACGCCRFQLNRRLRGETIDGQSTN